MLGTAARSLPLVLVAVSLMIGTVPARAEREGGLFEMLFGGGVRYKPRNEFPDPPKPRKVVAAPRVTGPSYYDYKADPLVKVDFAALRALPEKATFDPAPAEPSISAAAAGLDGFDLFAEKDVAKALADYYAANPQFIWVTSGGANAKAEQAIRLLGVCRKLWPVAGRLCRHRADRRRRWRRSGRPHRRAGAFRDDAVGARAALCPRCPERPRRSQPHLRLSRIPGQAARPVGRAGHAGAYRRGRRPISNRGIRRTPNTRRCASSSRR